MVPEESILPNLNHMPIGSNGQGRVLAITPNGILTIANAAFLVSR